ncbi:hypothetical protein KAR91_50395 [Candidatus Pacearchaeota archaeon]|nr:hypothetical protein [Candidatus Pacearchaeota archaeon]
MCRSTIDWLAVEDQAKQMTAKELGDAVYALDSLLEDQRSDKSAVYRHELFRRERACQAATPHVVEIDGDLYGPFSNRGEADKWIDDNCHSESYHNRPFIRTVTPQVI